MRYAASSLHSSSSVSRTHRARTPVASGELRGRRRAMVPHPVGHGISYVGQIKVAAGLERFHLVGNDRASDGGRDCVSSVAQAV